MVSRENSAVTALIRALPPEFDTEVGFDSVRLTLDGRSWMVRPIWAGEGLAADVQRARNMLVRADAPTDTLTVITARRMSAGAREILDEERLSWADGSGRARIVIPGEVYITRLDPIPADARRQFTWSGAAQAVAETLLSWRVSYGLDVPDSIGKVADIAQAADVSVAHAARVLRQFDEQHYTIKTGAERGSTATRELRDPGRMLSDWAGQYALRAATPVAEFHVPWRDHEESLSMLTSSLEGTNWAVTGTVAAERIAPFLTSIPTVDVYVSFDDLQDLRRRVSSQDDVREVAHGGRVRVFTEKDYVFGLTDNRDGLSLCSPVRVYADLLRSRGRAAEAAEHLRESAVGF